MYYIIGIAIATCITRATYIIGRPKKVGEWRTRWDAASQTSTI